MGPISAQSDRLRANPDSTGTDTTAVDDQRALRWLSTLWPLAILFHLGGNSDYVAALVAGTTTTVAIAQVALTVAAVLFLASPKPPAAVTLAALFLAVTWLKSPRIGNHEVLLALVSAMLLLSAAFFDDDWLRRVAGGLRWLFLIAYASMAISKLNHGFLSSDVSCAVVFGDEIGSWVGLVTSGNPVLARGSIMVALGTELAIPILLITRRWRNLGVIVGLIFHTALALDPMGHVFDFTSTLAPLFLLFADEEVWVDVNAVFDRAAERIRGFGVAAMAAIVVVGHGVVLASGWPRWMVVYPSWLVVTSIVIAIVGRNLWRCHRMNGDLKSSKLDARFALPLLPLLVLAAANGIAPYLQIRTAAAFNMYSNLETVVGEPNHLLFADLEPARAIQLAVITEAPSDHPLAFYRDQDIAIPLENLRYFQTRRAATVDSTRTESDELVRLRWLGVPTDGQPTTLVDVEPADTSWLDTLAYKLAYRRSVDLHSPARCLREWGPVG